MISPVEARQLIAAKILPLPAVTDDGPLLGRVLRQEIRATADVPPFDRSAMDGYAVALDDRSKKFRVVGEIQPGAMPRFKIKRGECARVFTGAPIPAGASQVLMQEDIHREGQFIRPLQRDATTFIRRRGEDARKGSLLLKSGMRLGPGEVAVLASLGITRPKMAPLIRVAHFATGNELVAPSEKIKPGQIRDSNSVLVAALVKQFGGEMIQQGRVPDDFDRLLKKVRTLKNQFDLLLVSGGASRGKYDFGSKLLNALKFNIHFEKTKLRPGKPLVFATRGRQAAFILPGNPVSHFVTMHLAVRTALERFLGVQESYPLVKARLDEEIDFRTDGRTTFWPARVEILDGKLAVHPRRWQSSGDVTGLVNVNALLQLDGNMKTPKPGDTVSVLMLDMP